MGEVSGDIDRSELAWLVLSEMNSIWVHSAEQVCFYHHKSKTATKVKHTYMSIESLFFPFLFFKDAQLLQALPGQSSLLKFSFTLTTLTMLIQNL